MMARDDDFRLYGTHRREAASVRLTAGKLSADMAGGNLRTISYDGTEVLRGIAYLVRDRDWGTYAPVIKNLVVDHSDAGFRITYIGECDGPGETDLTIKVTITGTADELTFDAEAVSNSGFETTRCGFCILHPIVSLAGTPVTVEHVNGEIEQTELPDLIAPWQPFKDMRAITHTVAPGVTAECRMEGDTFEMEDQRAWSDASYKTYVRPLALPWPYQIAPAEIVKQRITLRISDQRHALLETAVSTVPRPIILAKGQNSGNVPKIGIEITAGEAEATLASGELLARVAPQALLFHYDPLAGHDASAFRHFAALAATYPSDTTLEIAVPCVKTPAEELQEIAGQMRAAGFKPHAIFVSPAIDRQSTPPGSKWPECPPLEEVYAAARAAFPSVRLGGGMLSYFTEINRKRVPAELLDFISHCTNPIVHAADNLSVMQTLEALPFITKSIRAIYGDKPYRIGPSTIPMRQNPYGSRTMENTDGDRICMANRDPRQNGRFATAFAFGYAARILDANLEWLVPSALTGHFGLIAGKDEPVASGQTRPLFDIVRLLASISGSSWTEVVSSDPSKVLGIFTQSGEARHLFVGNMTAEMQSVDVNDWSGQDGLPGDAKSILLPPYSVSEVRWSEGGVPYPQAIARDWHLV